MVCNLFRQLISSKLKLSRWLLLQALLFSGLMIEDDLRSSPGDVGAPRRGAITDEGDHYLLSFRDIRMILREATDFHVLAEILIYNEYDIQWSRPTCVVDVGMNVGLASLFLPVIRT